MYMCNQYYDRVEDCEVIVNGSVTAAAEKAGEHYQYSIRVSCRCLAAYSSDDCHMTVLCLVHPQPCVENALHAFVHEFQQTVAPYLVGLVQQVQATDASADFASLRLKEAGECMLTVKSI